MAKEIDLKQIVTNLSKLGVTATVTKSRLELLKVLTPPTQTPQTQN
ncbi:Lmo0850 family protein [Solibacillus sp. FSL H8-0538]